jgi:hypothetical protein
MSSRALEMFKSGQGADCVIEVAPKINGQDKQVFSSSFDWCCTLLSYMTFGSVKNTQVRISIRVNQNEPSPKIRH